MIKPESLRIGNYVTINNPNHHAEIKDVVLSVTGISQNTLRGKSTHSISLEHIDQEENKYYESFSQFIKFIEPIPLTEEWLGKMKEAENKTPFPDWIQYVHEAQNWYYWNNNKKELPISL